MEFIYYLETVVKVNELIGSWEREKVAEKESGLHPWTHDHRHFDKEA